MKLRVISLKHFGQKLYSSLYDFLIVKMTARWYRQVLTLLPMNSTLLDIGIGTGTGLLHNSDLVASKGIRVVGVDYSEAYVKAAAESVASSSIRDLVTPIHASIFDYNKDYKDKYDAVYFSGSFMTLPNQVAALRHAARMLREKNNASQPNAKQRANIYFTQSFEKNNWFGRNISPLIKYLLSHLLFVDFGKITFEHDFRSVLKESGVEILEFRTMEKSFNRSAVLVCAKPIES